MKHFNLFIPITKVDEAKREVYGLATAELVDKSGEIFDYESSLPFYKEWSGEIQKASGGKSLGNVREMHSSIAAGKLTQINFNDEAKQIEVCAKIVNDSTWEKIAEGVLTGFSHGGEYIKTWKDPENPKLTRYTARPAELSVVDNPCLGAATFEMIRADGTRDMVKFKTKEPEMKKADEPKKPKAEPLQKWVASDGKAFDKKAECEAHELELEKADVKPDAVAMLKELGNVIGTKESELAGDHDPLTLGKKEFSDEKRKKLAESGAALPDGSFPIENEHDLKNAIHAYGRAANKDKAKAHIIARAKALGAESDLPDDWKEHKAADKAAPALGLQKFVGKAHLKKGMYTVCRAAEALMCLEEIHTSIAWEEEMEGDGSAMPDELSHIITMFCSFLENLVEEECHEIAEPHAVELMGAEDMEMAAGSQGLSKFLSKPKNMEKFSALFNKVANDALIKAGARHSAADKGHLTKAMGHLGDAVEHHEDAVKMHGHMGKAHEGMHKAHDGMNEAHKALASCMKGMCKSDEGDDHKEKLKALKAEMGEHLKKLGDHIDDGEHHLGKAEKHHEKMGKAHEGMATAHDGIHHALTQVGAGAGDHEKADDAGELKKAQDSNAELQKKYDDSVAANAALQKTLDEVQAIVPELTKRIQKLEAQPAPARGALYDTAGRGQPVAKGHEAGTSAQPVEATTLPGMTQGCSPEEQRRILFQH